MYEGFAGCSAADCGFGSLRPAEFSEPTGCRTSDVRKATVGKGCRAAPVTVGEAWLRRSGDGCKLSKSRGRGAMIDSGSRVVSACADWASLFAEGTTVPVVAESAGRTVGTAMRCSTRGRKSGCCQIPGGISDPFLVGGSAWYVDVSGDGASGVADGECGGAD
jgi:hypothetical protein